MWKKGAQNMIAIVCFVLAAILFIGLVLAWVVLAFIPDEMEETEETEVQMSMIRKMKQKRS